MRRKRSWFSLLPVIALVVIACAHKPPAGYEELSTEVKLNQVKGYFLGVREAYKAVRREKKDDGTPFMDDASFLLAVKADEAYTAAWNRYIQLRREGRDTPADLILVAENLKVLQGIVRQFAPEIMDKAPDILKDLLELKT